MLQRSLVRGGSLEPIALWLAQLGRQARKDLPQL